MKIKSDFENVASFGQKFGPNLAHLAQYGQIYSFEGRDFKIHTERTFYKVMNDLKLNLEKVAPSGQKFGQNLAHLA